MKLRNKLIATIVSISMVLAVIGVGAWASTESFTATITNTVNLEFDNISGQILVQAMSGADNLEYADEPYLQETTMFDGSNVIYNQISSSATSGQNLYWAGTRFLDSSDEGMQVLSNETTAAVYGYVFTYKPTEACVGTSTITAMVTQTSTPEIAGGKLMIKYFASTNGQYWTELQSGVPVTPIADNEMLMIVAVCQYYNLDGESITTTASAWDFEIVFSAGRAEKTALNGRVTLVLSSGASGVLLPYEYESPSESLWEIIEFGEYPQTLKSNNVTITSDTPDADGYYLGSDGERYLKHTVNLHEMSQALFKTNVAKNGTTMVNGGVYYFKIEPIKWRVLSDDGNKQFVVTDKILDYGAKRYIENDNLDLGKSGHYGNSDLRNFLVNEFYNAAFSETEKNKVLTTQLDDSKAYDYYAKTYIQNPSMDTDLQDKVFALSIEELSNPEYGFSSNIHAADEARLWQTTDYARAVGVMVLNETVLDFIAETPEEVALGRQHFGIGANLARTPVVMAFDPDQFVVEITFFCGYAWQTWDCPYVGCAPAMYISK